MPGMPLILGGGYDGNVKRAGPITLCTSSKRAEGVRRGSGVVDSLAFGMISKRFWNWIAQTTSYHVFTYDSIQSQNPRNLTNRVCYSSWIPPSLLDGGRRPTNRRGKPPAGELPRRRRRRRPTWAASQGGLPSAPDFPPACLRADPAMVATSPQWYKTLVCYGGRDMGVLLLRLKEGDSARECHQTVAISPAVLPEWWPWRARQPSLKGEGDVDATRHQPSPSSLSLSIDTTGCPSSVPVPAVVAQASRCHSRSVPHLVGGIAVMPRP